MIHSGLPLITLLLLFVSSMLFAFNGGDGSAGNPFQISTAAQLDSLRFYCGRGDSGKCFKIMNDIDLTNWLLPGNAGYNSGSFWLPIGDSTNDFNGELNGNNRKIAGLKINRPGANYIGLFSFIGAYGNVQSIGVTIKNGDTLKGDNLVGGLAGRSFGTISNCYVTGAMSGISDVGGLLGLSVGTVSNCCDTVTVSGKENVGMLVGTNLATVRNSHATGTVSGDSYVGGLVGKCFFGKVEGSHAAGEIRGIKYIGGLVGYSDSGIVSNSYATGTVKGTTIVGGLVGYSDSGTVSNSYATGTVNGSSSFIGGLVGFNFWGPVSYSYATGAVRGSSQAGGLVGENTGTVSYSYATGTVKDGYRLGGLAGVNSGGMLIYSYATGAVSGSSEVGGLVGLNPGGTVMYSYATGAVSGPSEVGGLVGNNVLVKGTVTSSYWDKQTTGQVISSGSSPSYGKTSEEMKTQPTFVSWDFGTTWSIAADKNNGYPHLKWQYQTAIKNSNAGNAKCCKKISLCCKDRTILFSSPLPAGIEFSLLDLNGRIIYRTAMSGTAFKLPLLISRSVVLWRVSHPDLISSGRLLIR